MSAASREQLPVAPLPDREDALDRATRATLDVLVVGGGITGAGIALDAASRGLAVALIERDDVASGTSSKSSKLVHGGLRYLAQRDFGLVHEALHERDLLRRIAPQLVRPLAFVVPTETVARRALVKAGLGLYDAMAAGRNVRPHERLTRGELLAAVPGLSHGVDGGGYRYYDCQTDDARLTLEVLQTARSLGALVVNHAEAVGLLRFGERVVGVTVRDRIAGREVDVTARWVISATGVWADQVRQLARAWERGILTPSKGVHLAFRAGDLHLRDGALIPSGEDDGRLIFVIPWGQQVIVGTTDEHHQGDLDKPSVTAPEAGYLLHAINTAFETRLTLHDAIGAWAGLRPLLRADHNSDSRDLSRRHSIFEEPTGLITVTGGKLTTYRKMAEDVVDRIVSAEGRKVPCMTDRVPVGLRGRVEDALVRLREVARLVGLEQSLVGSLLHRHGSEAGAVASFCAERGEADPLIPELPYLRGEVRWAVRRELARTLDDVLQRRMRVSLRHREAGGAAAAWAAGVMAEELGWSDTERERQLDSYLSAVDSERGIVALDTAWREDARMGQRG